MTLLPPIPYPSLTPHLNLKPHPHKQPFALPTPATTPTATPTALIVGAGLAGLAAAVHLHSSNTPFLLLEASDGVGGRVRTDPVDGFLLDRGFQILLTAYPEARRLLHYPSLSLRPFYPGALVYTGDAFHRVADPFRRPLHALASLANPVGTLPDKLLTGIARLLASARSDADILSAADESTIAHRLRSSGFSPSIVDRFFKPFLSGIFFDPDLSTTSRLFDFVLKCLALGDNVLPAAGIGAIPDQLAGRLPRGSVRLNSRVVEVGFGSSGVAPTVRLESGDVLAAELGLVVAVDQPEAERLLPRLAAATTSGGKPVRSTVCIYFSADRAAVEDPILILNGSGRGIVNNMFFATNVAPSYGPEGKVLVSVSLVGAYDGRSDDDLTAEVSRELGGWFGNREVGSWRHLRTYRIAFAQPDQTPPTDLVGKDPRVGDGVYVCGDYRSSATFDGALVSGRRAAEALIEDRALLH
ncbi:uncharacterized protein M6B38_266290 [Iris pallida]|uniref:Amine oxidase domain-containing protein n=1 Tax=Iris pallida TaxID=29817 RepID=A0AAX6IA35_IRIPA|nr:uncharacterized protein M6B38_266290 [Iris pallida]